MSETRIKFTYDPADQLAAAMKRAGLIPPDYMKGERGVIDPAHPMALYERVAEPAAGLEKHYNVTDPFDNLRALDHVAWKDGDEGDLDTSIGRERCGVRIRMRSVKRAGDKHREQAAHDSQTLLRQLLKSPAALEKPTVARGDDCLEQYFLTSKAVRESGVGENLAAELRSGSISLHCFLVEHDWRGVLAGASVAMASAPEGHVGGALTGEWHLPFDICAFEFRINGVHTVVLCSQRKEMERPSFRFAYRIHKDAWGFGECYYWAGHDRWTMGTKTNPPPPGGHLAAFLDLIFGQIRACCIMLEAEVATAPAIREPYRSNRPKAERGALPAFSYHVVKINHKARPEPLPAGSPLHGEPSDRRSPRFHFRRGHWRHYENYRKWILWMMVGDPDLGFIEKDYKL